MIRPITMTVACLVAVPLSYAAAPESPSGLEQWTFLIGEWRLVEHRYGFDSELIQTNAGHARFTHVMNGQRIQELQTMASDADSTTALHVFVYDPRSEEVEIARTDSGHYGFWVIGGTLSNDRMELKERHPDPESEVTRRITYERVDGNHFRRRLEFSTDKGESWFVRSEWLYTRS